MTGKQQAKGAYDRVTNTIQWLYRSTEASTLEEVYQFDRVLVFNTLLSCFYPWTISPGVEVHDIMVLPAPADIVGELEVQDDTGDTVVNDDDDTVIVYNFSAASRATVFKYLGSTVDRDWETIIS